MRIALITSSYPSTPGDPSGHFVRSSCEQLARQGHEIHVIAPQGSIFDTPSHQGKVWLHPAGGASLFRFPGALANAREQPLRLAAALTFAHGARTRLWTLRQSGEIHRIIAHWIIPSAFPLLLLSQPPSLHVYAHGADIRILLAAPQTLRQAIITSLLSKGAHFYFAAKTLQNTLATSLSPALSERLLTTSQVELPAMDMPNIAALFSRGQAHRASLSLRPKQKLALCIGRLIEGKRVELALAAAAKARAHLVIIGDGPSRRELTHLAHTLSGDTTFLGTLPRPDALAWLSAADALLHPSAAEAAPTVVREARLLKVPVIACDAGDIGLWAASDRGILVVQPSEFAERASTWLDQAVDASH